MVWPFMPSRLRMGRRSTCEPGRKARAPLNIDGEAALDALDDDALDGLFLVVGALNVVPGAKALSLLVGELGVTVFGLTLLAHDVDFVAGLEAGLALVIEDFGDGHHAFRLGADIDDDVGGRQLDHGAFDHVVIADRFFGLGGEVFEGGGKVVAGGGGFGRGGRNRRGRRTLVTGRLGSGRSFNSRGRGGWSLGSDGGGRSVGCGSIGSDGVGCGGSLRVRGRRLCGFGSVEDGRSAIVRVVFRVHGFEGGIRVTSGVVVVQSHSLSATHAGRDECGTVCSGLLAWSSGCVEGALADDP